MLDLVAQYERFIQNFRVLLYEQEENILRFKARMTFKDGSNLFIKEYIFEIDLGVTESTETSVADVLSFISQKMEG